MLTGDPIRSSVPKQEASPMAEIPKWRVAGDWFDVCSCDIPCPCELAQPRNRCFGVLAYHIRDGYYGDLPLAGLNLILLSFSRKTRTPEPPLRRENPQSPRRYARTRA